jgi:hypothetical protein
MPAYGASLARDTRDDWRSINAAMRHLQRDGQAGIDNALTHLRPMEERRRTFMLSPVRLGSDDEVKLVNRQHARAGTPGDQDDIKRTLIVGVLFWLYHFCADVLNAIVPGLGLLLPVVVCLWLWLRYKDRVIRALYSDAENLPQGMRRTTFTSPEVIQDYERRARKGKL